uniref:Uncharacterized protein n=1 Tax=Molossus molossus TaxID=27622 RepID=A0A7J8CZF1_MOLMO|nr:hypothetical protein HJG59_009440 [Molossus molossus]
MHCGSEQGENHTGAGGIAERSAPSQSDAGQERGARRWGRDDQFFCPRGKVNLETKDTKSKIKISSPNQDSVMLEFTVEEQECVIYFRCEASIVSVRHETSETTRSHMVTVRESFSGLRFCIHPEEPILEGTPMHINCTIQVAHRPWHFGKS